MFLNERFVNKLTSTGLLIVLTAVCAAAQTSSPLPDAPAEGQPTMYLTADPATDPAPSDPQQSTSSEHKHGLIVRSAKRVLEDEKGIYLAPFKPGAIKWDLLLLAGTGALIATDRRTSRALPTNHLDLWRNTSNVSLIGTSAALGSLWIYGLKTDNAHAKETGVLELETLSDTFLVYTPMQYIFGRERPEEGTGNGRFFVNRGINTSFPGGHPMFTWAMASVVAHEYPKKWVELLAYGAATSVSVSRFMGREHFGSDVLVGSTLGYLIGAYVFHTHCDPDLSSACHRSK